jgi:beta-galactosidase
MHAGMLRPDSVAAPALGEAMQVAEELAGLPDVGTAQAKVALIFDYASDWAWKVQPQGSGFDYFRLCFEMYRALRKLGLDVDIISPDTRDLTAYRLVLAPGLLAVSEGLEQALKQVDGIAVLGPRANSKTPELSIPNPLPPNVTGLDVTVTHVESFRSDMPRPIEGGGHALHWLDHVEGGAPVSLSLEDGGAILVGNGTLRYLTTWLDDVALDRLLRGLCGELNLGVLALEDGLRVRRTQTHLFAFNYGREAVDFEGVQIEPAGVFWREI